MAHEPCFRHGVPVLAETHATFPRELYVVRTGFAERFDLLGDGGFREERLRDIQCQHPMLPGRERGRALVKVTLEGETVRIASVLPWRNALVMAGSYVHSVLPYNLTKPNSSAPS